MELAPCPCGKTPTSLCVVADHDRAKYAYCYGMDCCGEWHIEFRNQYKTIGESESDALAAAAWNATPRAKKEPQP